MSAAQWRAVAQTLLVPGLLLIAYSAYWIAVEPDTARTDLPGVAFFLAVLCGIVAVATVAALGRTTNLLVGLTFGLATGAAACAVMLSLVGWLTNGVGQNGFVYVTMTCAVVGSFVGLCAWVCVRRSM